MSSLNFIIIHCPNVGLEPIDLGKLKPKGRNSRNTLRRSINSLYAGTNLVKPTRDVPSRNFLANQ